MSEWKYLPADRPYRGQRVVACYLSYISPGGKKYYRYELVDYSAPNRWITPDKVLDNPYCWAAIVEPGL